MTIRLNLKRLKKIF